MKIRNILHIILTLLIPVVLHSQNFSVKISSNRIGLNQTLQVNFIIEGQGSDFRAPAFANFRVISGPNTSSSVQYVNGHISQSLTYSYFLQPTRVGKFKIGSANVNIGGKSYTTNPINIEVVQGAQPNQPSTTKSKPSNTQQPPGNKTNNQNIKDNLYVKGFVSKSKPYEGEQILVTFKIYVNTALINYGISGQPKMPGFWVQEVDLPQNPQVRIENINGKQVKTATIYKAIIFPQKSGELRIDPMEVEAIVRIKSQQNRRRSVFDNFFNDPFFGDPFGGYKDVKIKIKSNQIKIKVKPHPSNAPSDFDGITGRYTMEVTTDKTETKTNEPVTFTIKIKGKGNIKLIPAFDLNLPEDIETYEPKTKENISTLGDVISGSKTFEYLLIPRAQGSYKLPPVTFTYFDPGTGRYNSLSSKEIIIEVDKGSSEEYVGPSIVSKKAIELRGKDIQFIRLDPDNIQKESESFFGSRIYLILLTSPFFIFILLLVYKKQITKAQNNIALVKMKKATSLAKKHFRTAKKYLKEKDKQEFYTAITNAFNRYVCDKMQIEAADLSRDKIKQELLTRNVKEESVNNLINLLDDCDFARYAPSQSNKQLDQIYSKSLELLSTIEKEIKK